MVGGYLTFQGIDAKARHAGSPVEAALPVTLETVDDRVEVPFGALPMVQLRRHPIVTGLDEPWPALLGYNRVAVRDTADLVVTVGDDPLVVAGDFGRGRSVAFTSDCGPHWCPPSFMAWAGYAVLWDNIIRWLARD